MINWLRNFVGNGAPWRPISSAPRDGTIIEIENSYGIAPWYGLHRWTRDAATLDVSTGERHPFDCGYPRWVSATDPSKSLMYEQDLRWRPYVGDVSEYTDPTNGEQDTSSYWLRAAGKAGRRR